jgi:hypothetical protein
MGGIIGHLGHNFLPCGGRAGFVRRGAEANEPFASLLKGDLKVALADGHKVLLEIVAATHAGMTTEEFETTVRDWIATAKHPKTGRPYVEMAYLPMLELLAYLRGHDFKTYIVSGGGVEFMRPWTEKVYGVPPKQVIGSSIKTRFDKRAGKPVLVRLPDSSSSTMGRASRSPSKSSLAAAPFSRSVIPTAICRCSSGPLPAPGPGSWAWSITPMPHANGLTTARRNSASSARRSKRHGQTTGRWSI